MGKLVRIKEAAPTSSEIQAQLNYYKVDSDEIFKTVKNVFLAAYANNLFDAPIHRTGMKTEGFPFFSYRENVYDFFAEYPYIMTKAKGRVFFFKAVHNAEVRLDWKGWTIREEDLIKNEYSGVVPSNTALMGDFEHIGYAAQTKEFKELNIRLSGILLQLDITLSNLAEKK